MLDMTFVSFLTLLIISLIAGLVMHYAVGYRVLAGIDGFAAKWVTAWFGAWLASPVLGHWFAVVKLSDVYIIPAFVGAFIGAFLPAALGKGVAAVLQPGAFEVHATNKAA